jgi:hypothetical protein
MNNTARAVKQTVVRQRTQRRAAYNLKFQPNTLSKFKATLLGLDFDLRHFLL